MKIEPTHKCASYTRIRMSKCYDNEVCCFDSSCSCGFIDADVLFLFYDMNVVGDGFVERF